MRAISPGKMTVSSRAFRQKIVSLACLCTGAKTTRILGKDDLIRALLLMGAGAGRGPDIRTKTGLDNNNRGYGTGVKGSGHVWNSGE